MDHSVYTPANIFSSLLMCKRNRERRDQKYSYSVISLHKNFEFSSYISWEMISGVNIITVLAIWIWRTGRSNGRCSRCWINERIKRQNADSQNVDAQQFTTVDIFNTDAPQTCITTHCAFDFALYTLSNKAVRHVIFVVLHRIHVTSCSNCYDDSRVVLMLLQTTRSSALAERPRDASYH